MANNLPPEGDYEATILDMYLGYDFGERAVRASLEWPSTDKKWIFNGEWAGKFNDKGRERTKSALRTCGWKGVSLATLDECKGRTVGITVKHTKAKKSDNWYLTIYINERKRMTAEESTTAVKELDALLSAPPPGDDGPPIRLPDEDDGDGMGANVVGPLMDDDLLA